MLQESSGDPSLYPGEVDADGAIKADRSIMEDEMEDEMETPPPGYQGQITLKVRILSALAARLCMFMRGRISYLAIVFCAASSRTLSSTLLTTLACAAGPNDRVGGQGLVRRPQLQAQVHSQTSPVELSCRLG